MRSTTPVSYTHLDVYKRQSRSSLLEQAEVIHLGPLTIHEQQQFVSENHVAASEHALQHLASKIGGHPLLWSRLISRAQALDCSLDQLGVPSDLFEQDLMRLQREVHHHGLFPAVQRLCSNPTATLSAVSYTHLDVYKRQPQLWFKRGLLDQHARKKPRTDAVLKNKAATTRVLRCRYAPCHASLRDGPFSREHVHFCIRTER